MDSLKILERLIKDGANERDIVLYLADNVPLTELARDYYNLYLKSEKLTGFTPMRISQSDFNKHFRIIGFKADGTKEQRGANRWNKG
jgi:hypothetical protein